MKIARSEVTSLIQSCADGDDGAFDRLFSVVYGDLRVIAHRQLGREAKGHTLQTTALVHECYVGLVDQDHSSMRDRAHFFALASRAMRHILIDYARRKNARKRGGTQVRVTLGDELAVRESPVLELLALDKALSKLGSHNERMARIVECRFFGGMTVEETAEALSVSTNTIYRLWSRAKAHLYLELVPADGSGVPV